MLFARKRKTSPLARKAKKMPHTKKVQFCYIKTDELSAMLASDIRSVLSLEPVNYYAEKNRFYQCVFYYTEELSDIIMNFELYENDRRCYISEFYSIEKELYAKILLKFGQRIVI